MRREAIIFVLILILLHKLQESYPRYSKVKNLNSKGIIVLVTSNTSMLNTCTLWTLKSHKELLQRQLIVILVIIILVMRRHHPLRWLFCHIFVNTGNASVVHVTLSGLDESNKCNFYYFLIQIPRFELKITTITNHYPVC